MPGECEGSGAMDRNVTGMTGVYCTAAELSRRGYIVSPTSRSARGADLLVTDQSCRNAWSVQVKTNAAKRNSWQVGREDALVVSQTHHFVFVTLNGRDRPSYMVVRSSDVANKVKGKERAYFNRGDGPRDEGWELFEETAVHELTWEGARQLARQPHLHPTARLEKALTLLKPAQDNKLDRGHRKRVLSELKLRGDIPT
jgi:hypothetical protein